MAEEKIAPEQAAADDAAFATSFNTTRGDVAPAVEQPEVKVADTPAEKPEPAKAAEPDPWEGVSPAVKTELENTRGKLKTVESLDHRFKSFEGRLGSIFKTLETLAAAKEAATTVADAPTQAQMDASSASSAKWKQLKEDFPDWAEAMEERLTSLRAAIPKAQAPVDVAALRNEIAAELQAEQQKRTPVDLQAAEELALVRFVHRNWRQDVSTPEFKAWRAKQAPEIQALGASVIADDAIRMLDLFKADNEKQKAAALKAAANKDRLARAAAPQGVAAPAATTINDEDAFTGGFAAVRGG